MKAAHAMQTDASIRLYVHTLTNSLTHQNTHTDTHSLSHTHTNTHTNTGKKYVLKIENS